MVFGATARDSWGQNWQAVSGPPSGVGASGVGGGSGNTLYAGFGGSGAYKSTDNGLNWVAVNNGLADAFGGILPPKMFLRTSTGRILRGGDNASWNNGVGGPVFYTDDAGGSWTMAPYPFGSPTANPGGIAFTDMVELNGVIYATDTLSAGVWKSTDNGVTWTDAGNGLPFTPFTSYRFARGLTAANSKLYVATPSRGLWRSADGGNTWQELNSGIPGADNVLTGIIRVGNDVKALANGTLFAAVDNAVWRSTNEGATWVNVSAGYLGVGEEARRLAVLGNNLYVCLNSGGANKVWESADQGASFAYLSSAGLPAETVSVLSQSFYAHNAALYLACTNGLYRLDTAAAVRLPFPPALVAGQPSLSVNEGLPLTLKVEAAGTPPLSYAWYREGTLVGQNANQLTIAAATTNDQGGYWVVISNAGGSTSNYFVLTVAGNHPGAPDYTFNAGKGSITLKKGFMNLFDGTATSRAVQPDGKILIGGDFTQVNGVAANYLVRVNPDGTVDPSFNTAVGANGIVRAIAVQPDGKIVIGGEFTQVNGVYAARVARLNADGSFDFTFNQGYGLDGVVYALAVQADGRILLGGNFASYNQYTATRLARLLPNGEFDPAFRLADPPNNTVETVLTQPDGGIVIGGSFTQMGTTSRQRVGRYNPDLTLDTNFNTSSGASSTVRGLLQLADGRLILAGDFSAYRGTTFAGLVRVNADSTLDSSYAGINNGSAGPWITNLNNAIGGQAVAASGGTLAIGADLRPFYQATTQRYLGVAPALAIIAQPAGAVVRPGSPVTLNVTATGTSAISYQWRKNGGNLGQTGASLNIAAAQAGDAGDYTVVVSNASGSWTSLVARVVVSNLPVITLASTNILVAETAYYHLSANVVGPGPLAYQWYRNGVALSDATNAAITRYGMQRADSGDYTVAVAGPGGAATSAVLRVTVGFIPGHIHDTFGPSTGNSVTINAVALLPDGRIMVGGNFTTYAGQNRTNLLVFNADGTVHTGFNARTNFGTINHIALQPDGKILAASGAGRLLRLLPDGAVDTNFVAGTAAGITFADVRRVAVSKTGKIFALGNFRTWNGVGRTNLVMLNPDGSLGPDLGYPNALLLAQAPNGEGIAVGSGVSLSVDIRRLNADGVTVPTFNARTVDPASYLGFDPQGNLYAAGYFQTVGVGASTYPRSLVAKWLPDGSLDQNFAVDDSIAYIQTVNDMVFQTDGRILIAGNFTLQTNQPIANLARLTATGKVDKQFSGYLGGANLSALAYYPDGRVVVVGSFTVFNARAKYGAAMFQTERNDPAVVFQPLNQIINQGEMATFEVTPVAGENLTYVWRRNSVVVPGATGAVLSISNATLANSGAYTVEVTSTGGSATYSVGSLVVLGAPIILANPASPDAVTGNPFTLTVSAIGLAPLYYQWFKDGSPVGITSTNPAYTIASASAGDSGNYTVLVSNTLGTATSAGTIVTVISQPGALSTTFSNVLGGAVVGFAVQRDGKIVVAANNQNPGLYRLHPDGTRDTNFVSNIGSVTTLKTVALDPQDRIYVGFNTGELRRYASSGTQESNYVANVGAVTRTYVVLGLPDGKILVGRDGAMLRLNENGSVDNTFTNVIGEVYDLALLPDGKILAANWASYGYVRRLNPDGSTDTTFDGTVQANSTVFGGLPLPDARVLAYGQFGSYGGVGKTFLARLLPNGQLDPTYSNAVPNAFIRRMALQDNGRPLMVGNFSAVGGSNRTYVARLNADGSHDTTFNPPAPNNSVTHVQVLPDGRILIGGIFSTVGGVAHRGLAALNGDIVNLGFLRQPVGGVTLNVGSPLSLEVATTATSPVGYQWYRNGAPIPAATAAAYNLGTTTTNDAGAYYVVASNLSGAKTSLVANVTILAAPDFLAQPLSTNGFLNKSVTLAGQVVGVAPLAVQWLKDGAPLANATNLSLTLTNLQFTNAGAYALVASNSLGVVTSAVANLTVTILQGSADLAFNPGGVGPNSTVNALYTLPDGRIYVSGGFTTFNGSTTNRYIVRLNANGALDQSFAYSTNFSASVLAVDGQGRLLAASGTQLRRILPNGTTDTSFPAAGITFNFAINTLTVQPDGKILIGGVFTTPANYLVRLNDDGTRDDTFTPAVAAVVDSLLLLPNGSFLVGSYNGGTIQLRRFFADGSLDNSWTSPSFSLNGRIYSILPLADGKFLIAGAFTTTSRSYLARINSNGSVDTTYAPPTLNGGIVQAIFQDDGKLLIRGSFDTIGGVVSTNFARLNADLTPDASFVSGLAAYNQHNAMALQYDGRIILGGSFTSYDGNNQSYLAAAYGQPVPLAITNPPTAQTVNLSAPLTLTAGVFAAGPVTYQWFKNGVAIPGATSATLTIAQAKASDSGVYTVQVSDGANTRASAGALVTVLGSPLFVRQPASLVTTQGLAAAFAPIVQGQVPMTYQWWFNGAPLANATNPNLTLPSVTAVQSGQYWLAATNAIGGALSAPAFLSVGVLPAGTVDPNFATNSGGNNSISAFAVAPDGGMVYAGGNFSFFDGGSRANFVRLNSDGARGANYQPNVGGALYAMGMQADGKVLVGGAMSSVTDQNGVVTMYGLARLLTNGFVDRAFTNLLNSGSTVYGIRPHNGGWLVGGWFNNVGGLARSNLARITAEGAPDAAFGAPDLANNIVQAMATDAQGRVLIGGQFTSVLGQPRARIARLTASGGLDTTFTNTLGANLTVRAIAVQTDGKILVGGDFTQFNGLARNYLVRLNEDGSVDTNFVTTAGSSVYDIDVLPNGKIIIAGYFTTLNTGAGNFSHNRLARLNPNGTLDATFATASPSGGVIVVEPQPDGSLLVGGAFTTIGGLSRGNLARLLPDGQLAPLITAQPVGLTANPGDSASLSVGVAGLNPLRFQWRKDGTNLPNATNAVLTLANLTTNSTGGYSVVITNSAGAATSAVAGVSVSLGGGYAAWAAEQQLPPGLDGPADDADGDGFPNIVEYALASHPGQAGSRRLPTRHFVRSGNQDYPALQFIRPKNLQGVVVQIDAATDVRFGQPVATLQEGAAEDLGDGTERVTIRVNTTLTQTPLIFFRARVVAE